ncbi:MAG: peptide-methionine (R)-S-oxide reductase MsrB [Parvibaculales bacterium]
MSEPKIIKTDDQWRAELTEDQYHITRCAGTERAFTGPYWDTKGTGTYHCVCCNNALFDSETKYDSGSGWPSFYQPVTPDCVNEVVDVSHGMRRTEIICSHCHAHLGHVFPDGPQPTGLRYCINGTALKLETEEG